MYHESEASGSVDAKVLTHLQQPLLVLTVVHQTLLNLPKSRYSLPDIWRQVPSSIDHK